MECEHYARDVSGRISDRRGTIIYGNLSSVAGYEDSVVRKAHNLAFPQDPAHGVLGCFSGLFVDDVEYLCYRLPGGILERPAGHFFRHGIHERDLSFNVGGNDRIADARKSGGPALLALAKGGLLFEPKPLPCHRMCEPILQVRRLSPRETH